MGIFRRFQPVNQATVTIPVMGADPYAARYIATLSSKIATVMDGGDGGVYMPARYSRGWHGWFQGPPPQRFTGAAGGLIYGSPRPNSAGDQKKTLQAVLQDTQTLQAWLAKQTGGQ